VRGVVVHLTRQMTEADWTIEDGIPVTSVPRTLLGLAPLLSPRELIKAMEQAERLRLFDLRGFEELLGRSRGRRGAKALRAALAELHGDAPDTKSPLEDRFFDFCLDRGLEPPQPNVIIAGYGVDAAWPKQRVVVELDSRAHHTGLEAFEEDRKRDTKMQVVGFQIVRVTDRRVTHEPDKLDADLRSLLR
jgi:hypothetical protein